MKHVSNEKILKLLTDLAACQEYDSTFISFDYFDVFNIHICYIDPNFNSLMNKHNMMPINIFRHITKNKLCVMIKIN